MIPKALASKQSIEVENECLRTLSKLSIINMIGPNSPAGHLIPISIQKYCFIVAVYIGEKIREKYKW